MDVLQLDKSDQKILRRYISFSPTDLWRMSEDLGATVFDVEDIEKYQVDRRNGAIIVMLNPSVSPTKYRYYWAMALAEIMLARVYKNPSELKISDLAIEMLMPEKLIDEYCALNNCDPVYHERIAEHFEVSLTGLRLRLKELGYSWDDQGEAA